MMIGTWVLDEVHKAMEMSYGLFYAYYAYWVEREKVKDKYIEDYRCLEGNALDEAVPKYALK